MRKGLSLLAFLLFLAGVLIYPRIMANSQENEVSAESFDYEAWRDNQEQVLEGKLSFTKEIPVFYMEELNLGGLDSNYAGAGVKERATFNEETRSLYLTDDESLPNEKTQAVLLSKTYSLDVLLSDGIDNLQGPVRYPLTPLDPTVGKGKNPVRNEERLFLGSEIEVGLAENGKDMLVTWTPGAAQLRDGSTQAPEQWVIQPGSSEVIERNENGLRSRLLFVNYGPWSSKNVTYVIKQSQ